MDYYIVTIKHPLTKKTSIHSILWNEPSDPSVDIAKKFIRNVNTIVLMWNGIAYHDQIYYGVKWCIEEPDIELTNQIKEKYDPQLFIAWKHVDECMTSDLSGILSRPNESRIHSADDMEIFNIDPSLEIVVIEAHTHLVAPHNLIDDLVDFHIEYIEDENIENMEDESINEKIKTIEHEIIENEKRKTIKHEIMENEENEITEKKESFEYKVEENSEEDENIEYEEMTKEILEEFSFL